MFLLFNMISFLRKNLKLSYLVFIILPCFFVLLAWCWSSWSDEKSKLNISDFVLECEWNVELEKVPLNNDDLDEIIDLYEEVWDNLKYRDSLLVAQKFSKWLWINAFVQENLDVLEDYDLTVSNIHKTQIQIKKDDKKLNSVLVDYEISEWFIPDIPLLYISQLFILSWDNVLLFSFTTEDSWSRNNMSNSFKNIK